MKALGVIFSTIAIVLLLFLSVYCIYAAYVFDRDCESYLKLAGDAPTVEKADAFLGKAIAHLERAGKTSGNSAVIFKTPTNDVGIWFGQLSGAKQTTEAIIAKAEAVTQLERDNALMKIREVVLDDKGGETGTAVTLPAHISIVPHQVIIIVLWWLLIPLGVAGVVCLWRGYDW